jgi:hypothetical protein
MEEEEFGFIANNGDGMDLVHNSYILPFLRTMSWMLLIQVLIHLVNQLNEVIA